MKKKQRIFRPRKTVEQRTSEQGMIAAMRQLGDNDNFKLLQGDWINSHSRILQDGMDKPSVEQWHVLKGFYMATMAQDRWASKQTRDDDMKRRAEALKAHLREE